MYLALISKPLASRVPSRYSVTAHGERRQDGGRAPADGSSADTREFAARGDSVTATFKAAEQGSLSDFADTWQNTVRVPPSPRR